MSQQSNQQIAARLIEKMNDRQSPFDLPGFAMPVNPTTGKAYRGMNALWLAMQGPRDPRWMTLKQASNKNGWKIQTGSKGTLISFLKTTDRVQLLDDQGKPQLNSRRNPKTELIKLANPVETDAYVFNATQIEGILSLKEYEERRGASTPDPMEQLGKLVELSNAKVETTIGEPGYDAADRIIYMPEPDSFGTPQEYQAALLYEVVKFAGQDKELFDPMDVSAAEQTKPALAALFIGSEIGVYSQLAPQMNVEDVYETALNMPDELEKAANNAQYITDYLHGLINSPEQRQAARQDRILIVGDVIDYNDKQYEVMGKLRGKDLQVMDKSTGNRFKASPGDGIYASLLSAKIEALKSQREQNRSAAPEQGEGIDQEQDNTIQYEHENELENEADNVVSFSKQEGTGSEEDESNILDFSEEYEEAPELNLDQEAGEKQKSGRKR
ncbi:ArdC-like ssDNA-binding domain-containing protein [Mucilaginibacter jinjuensis]|uniref:ArdC-like ssDNA-binding domain-containing protein n=1 Tax=Mucilaginibacter jinjuensis TaxID=1176721 RepID=A0ABY7TAT5_9SPHI|nr:ArdC-like ssDNA-binding domain-containing protein [Mucilaginibacter jinjuensis]WCT13318.1 ArdC-like ssDNA-binding domain-containing protein [Mucilaginibacter jinjuensis]